MNAVLQCAVDFGRRYVRVVVCDGIGHVELERYTWERAELAEKLLPALHEVGQKYDCPVRLAGRVDAPWPDGLPVQLQGAGVDLKLLGGEWLRDMLWWARACHEDTKYEKVSFLAACAAVQTHCSDLDSIWEFVVNWYIQRNRDRRSFLECALPYGRPSAWLENESLAYLQDVADALKRQA